MKMSSTHFWRLTWIKVTLMRLIISTSAMISTVQINFSVSEEDITTVSTTIQRTDQESQVSISKKMFQMMLRTFLPSLDSNVWNKESELVNFSEILINWEVGLLLKHSLELGSIWVKLFFLEMNLTTLPNISKPQKKVNTSTGEISATM